MSVYSWFMSSQLLWGTESAPHPHLCSQVNPSSLCHRREAADRKDEVCDKPSVAVHQHFFIIICFFTRFVCVCVHAKIRHPKTNLCRLNVKKKNLFMQAVEPVIESCVSHYHTHLKQAERRQLRDHFPCSVFGTCPVCWLHHFITWVEELLAFEKQQDGNGVASTWQHWPEVAAKSSCSHASRRRETFWDVLSAEDQTVTSTCLLLSYLEPEHIGRRNTDMTFTRF